MEGLKASFKDLTLSVEGEEENWTEVTFSGRIEASTIDRFMNGFDEQLERNQTQIIINMDGVEYITSTGLGGLIKYHNLFEEEGGEMVLLEPPEVVMSVLSLLGFQDVLNISDDIDDFMDSRGADAFEEDDEDEYEDDVEADEDSSVSSIFNAPTAKVSDHSVLTAGGLDIETFADSKPESNGIILPNAAVAVPTKKKRAAAGSSAKLKKLKYDQNRVQAKGPEKIVRKKTKQELPPQVDGSVAKQKVKKKTKVKTNDLSEEITISSPGKSKPTTKAKKAKTVSEKQKPKSERRQEEERRAVKERRAKSERRQNKKEVLSEDIEIGEPIKAKPKQSQKRKSQKVNAKRAQTSGRLAASEPVTKSEAPSKKKAKKAKIIRDIEDDDDFVVEPEVDEAPSPKSKKSKNKPTKKKAKARIIEDDFDDEDDSEEFDVEEFDDDIKAPNMVMVFVNTLIYLAISTAGGFAYYFYSGQKDEFKLQLLMYVGIGLVLPAILIYLVIKIMTIIRLKKELED